MQRFGLNVIQNMLLRCWHSIVARRRHGEYPRQMEACASASNTQVHILVGFMKDGNMPVIRRHRLYYIPAVNGTGCSIDLDVARHVKYVLLHTEHNEIRWLFGVDGEPCRISGQEVRAMRFLTRGHPDSQYIAYRLSEGEVDVDGFDVWGHDIPDRAFRPYFITLSR